MLNKAFLTKYEIVIKKLINLHLVMMTNNVNCGGETSLETLRVETYKIYGEKGQTYSTNIRLRENKIEFNIVLFFVRFFALLPN